MINDDGKKLVIDFTVGKVSRDKFLKQMSLRAEDVPTWLVKSFQRAIAAKNSDEFSHLMLLGFSFEFPVCLAKVFSDLLMEDWHVEHENIAIVLKQFKSPETIDGLFWAVDHFPDYLEYDDGKALSIKCIWALGAISDHKAMESLKKIAKSEVEDKRRCAEEQLRLNGF